MATIFFVVEEHHKSGNLHFLVEKKKISFSNEHRSGILPRERVNF